MGVYFERNTQNFLCVLYLTGFRMTDLFELKRENLNAVGIYLIESKNKVEHYKEYSKMLSHYLNRALEHATLAGERYNDGEVSEDVFTNRYGRPLTYDGLRAAMRICACQNLSKTVLRSSTGMPAP
ncbi:MAG: tyrosine-type recombinase/integrase [Steroidobacteraceae bacterium]